MRIHITVTPKAHNNELVDYHNEVLKIRVTAVPEKGKANEAVLRLLARTFHVPVTSLSVVVGASMRKKIIDIPGVHEEDVLKVFKKNRRLL